MFSNIKANGFYEKSSTRMTHHSIFTIEFSGKVMLTHLLVMVVEYRRQGMANIILAVHIKVIVISDDVFDILGCSGYTIAKYLKNKCELFLLQGLLFSEVFP